MLKRRIEPINANRLKYLGDSRSLAGDRALRPREIFRALILPVCHEIAKSRHKGKLGPTSRPQFYRTRPLHPENAPTFFRELSENFVAELQRTYPKASPKDLYWNLHLVISSMLGTFAQHRRLGDFSKGICDENDVEDLSRRLIDFVSTGFEAGINSSSE